MQHSIKDLWLYPFPEIDVVHTQEALLPDPTLSATAIAPPMMSLSEDWLNGYRKHALPSPPGSGPYLH